VNEQLDWYLKHSNLNRKVYFSLKAVQIVVAANIPVFSSVEAVRTDAPWFIAALGASIVVMESFHTGMSRPSTGRRSAGRRLGSSASSVRMG
jgi:hypothetical protein